MAGEFCDIMIGAVNEAESYRRSGGFIEQVYYLSPEPGEEWERLFTRLWDEVEFFPKRHARIENHCAVFVCLEHELQGYPMEQLVETVAKTNAFIRDRASGPGG